MDSQINDRIKSIFSDPESMKSILSIVSALGSGKSDSPEVGSIETPEEHQLTDTENQLVKSDNTEAIENFRIPKIPQMKDDDDKIKLLLSIKPFLNDKKRTRVDSLVKALGAARIISAYKDMNIFQ